jgi:SAM-dependent methyltransferase
MAHIEQLTFVSFVKECFVRTKTSELKILEIGSYDVNGSIRKFFQDSSYVGVDLCAGPGVDLVSFGHEVSLPDASFDIAISCECFEHDPNWIKTLNNMYRMTKSGGMVVVTCATLGRLEHGTRRTASEFSPGTQFVGLDYYRNLDRTHFEAELNLQDMFSEYLFFTMPTSFDLYFVGWKNGETQFIGDKEEFKSKVESIRNIRKFRFKLYDVPVNIARSFMKEEKFQDFACNYYNAIKPFRGFIKSLTHPQKA